MAGSIGGLPSPFGGGGGMPNPFQMGGRNNPLQGFMGSGGGAGPFDSFWQNAIPQGEFFSSNPRFRNMRTANSSLVNGQVTLDPSIRRLQEQALARSGELSAQAGQGLEEFLGQSRGLRGRLTENQGALVNARVAPILQERDMALGEAQRQAGLRGIGGSSFATQQMNSIRNLSAKAESDARAQAEMETIAALSGVDQSMLSAIFNNVTLQSALNNENLEVSKARLTEELAGLGLAQGQIDMFLRSFENFNRRAQQERQQIMDTTTDFMGMFMPTGGPGGTA